MVLYDGSHSILFMNDADFDAYKSSGMKTRHKHSWEDWRLVPSSRPVISSPSVKTKTVDIPGMDGVIDLTEVLAGKPRYGNRSGSLNFIVTNDHESWHTIYSAIMNYFHGKRVRAILLDAPDYYFEGRWALNEWKSDPKWSQITLNYDLDPYKYTVYTTIEDWPWDPFNFETGVIRLYKDLKVNGTLSMKIVGYGQDVVPTITCSSAMTFKINNKTYNLTAGSNYNPEIVIKDGENSIVVTGNGTISINYRGQSL